MYYVSRFRVGSTYYWVDCTLGNSRIIGSGKEYDPKKLMQANQVILLCNNLSKKSELPPLFKRAKKIILTSNSNILEYDISCPISQFEIFLFAYDIDMYVCVTSII